MMSVTKRINGDYTITTATDSLANVTISTNTLYIDGNLQVGGNATMITKTDMSITDNLIVLNKGEASSGITLGTAGLEVDRGLSPNVQLIYNDTYHKWQITNDGSLYANITATTGVGTMHIVDDTAPQLGGNLDVLARSIFSSNTQQVKFDSNVAVKTQSVTPTAISGYNIVYSQTPGGGGSGLYVTNSSYTAQELATKSAAIKYSIIFG